MSENTRNQHKNTMKDRPSGQSSLMQFGDDDIPCYICGMFEANHDDVVCKNEYEGNDLDNVHANPISTS